MAKTKTKKPTQKVKSTLDQKHTEKITRLTKLKNSIPSKKIKLKRLKKELDTMSEINPNKYTRDDIRQKSYLMDSINRIQLQINSIENCNESLNYIVNTLPILICYYDSSQIMSDGVDEDLYDNTTDGKKNILSYFIKQSNTTNTTNTTNKKSKTDKSSTTNSKKVNSKSVPTKDLSGNKISPESTQKMSKAKLYDNYLSATDINYRIKKAKKSEVCNVNKCDGEKIFSQVDGCLVCGKCGVTEPVLLAVDKPNYKEPTQDSCTYAYKRINHLTEILSQLQAKESTDILPKVFESIIREIKKRKINKNDLDIFKLRRILKKLDYRKYYEHVPHILQIINGKEPPNFSRNDELKIKKMFKDIQKPFEIYCPKNRKNFLNYSYVLHKFCELLDLDEYISYFPLLKNNTKLLQHDRIWNNICKYMRWKYYKSI